MSQKEEVSVVVTFHGQEHFIPLIRDNYQRFKEYDKQTLELVIVDDGSEDLSSKFSDLEDAIYIHLDDRDLEAFFEKIISSNKQENENLLYYQKRIKDLPSGFKRDYACGMSNYEYIFHMNADCVYNSKSIDRKMRFLKKTSADCVYSDTTLAYDIYNHTLYKTISKNKIYESTIFHKRDFWKRRGFQWSEVEGEGRYFHHNNGNDRKLDNYYDVIQLLSIHNINLYEPVEVSLEGVSIDIPKIVDEIEIVDHPFVNLFDSIYQGDTINILGVESEFLENVTRDHWTIKNRSGKWKQTKLAKEILEERDHYHILLWGSKHPAWDLFDHVRFDMIVLETRKNWEQMVSIIANCKSYDYIYVKGIFIRKDFLDPKDMSETAN